MDTIRTTVHNGRIDVHVAADLPDGTEVEIRIFPTSADYKPGDRILDDTPEAIEAWIKAVRQLEPLLITPEEQTAWDAAEAQQKQWDKDHFFDRVDRLAKEASLSDWRTAGKFVKTSGKSVFSPFFIELQTCHLRQALHIVKVSDKI